MSRIGETIKDWAPLVGIFVAFVVFISVVVVVGQGRVKDCEARGGYYLSRDAVCIDKAALR